MRWVLIPCLYFTLLYSFYAVPHSVASITYVSGRVDLVSLVNGSRREARVNTKVGLREQIRTSHRSEVHLLLADSSQAQIGPFSVVHVKPLRPPATVAYLDELPISVRMLSGKIRLKTSASRGGGRRFFFKTATLVASADGAELACISTINDARLVVLAGNIEVANRADNLNQAYRLKERQETRVRKGQVPSMPQFLPDEILNNYLENYEVTPEKKIRRRVREPETFVDRLLKNQRKQRVRF